jgi:hypothetical protein
MVNFTTLLFYPWGNSPLYPLYSRLVGPGATLDIVEERKISCLYWESNSKSLVVQPIA